MHFPKYNFDQIDGNRFQKYDYLKSKCHENKANGDFPCKNFYALYLIILTR